MTTSSKKKDLRALLLLQAHESSYSVYLICRSPPLVSDKSSPTDILASLLALMLRSLLVVGDRYTIVVGSGEAQKDEMDTVSQHSM